MAAQFHRPSDPSKPATSWCAIYTRKSTDENLNTEFNSLDSQREYCESFIRSREPEGWRTFPETYTDPGFSGGNMDRPGLKKLLADARSGKFQVLVCYKYDRLSRNTKDFLHILELFDRCGVAFVSVTQPIDTTSSVGRLMRSILMDFSQFEREMIAERTRDKLNAMAQKGKRTGGHPILGYDIDPEKKTLLVNRKEAKQAIEMFKTYIATKSLSATAKTLNERGYRMKQWTTRTGNLVGGAKFNKATVFNLLKNQIYTGMISHRKKVYQGEHKGIIPGELFEETQQLLARNGNGVVNKDGYDLKHNYILKGLMGCAACGTTMTPYSCINRVRQRFFYYRCISVAKMDKTACPVRSVPAKALEEHVINRLSALGQDKTLVEKVVARARESSSQDLPIKREEKKLRMAELTRAQGGIKNLMAHLAQEKPDSRRRERILAEIDECIAREEEIKTVLAKLETQIIELEKREIDADVVRRNLANFTKIFSGLSACNQRELMHLLVRKITYDAQSAQLTIDLNPLPDLWGDWTKTGDVSVDRQTSLPDGYTVQNGLEQYNGFPPDLTRFLRSLGFCAVADPYHFEQVQVAKGRIRILPPLEAQLIKSKQRRYKLQRDPQPFQLPQASISAEKVLIPTQS